MRSSDNGLIDASHCRHTGYLPKVLILSQLYPSSDLPTDGIFIHNEVKALIQAGVAAWVLSPVPWAPKPLHYRPKWGRYARISKLRGFDGVPVSRPSFFALPYPLNASTGLTMALRLLPLITRIRKLFPFDIIHSHNLTPSGLAGCLLAKQFSVPSVCTVRGSDLNVYPHYSRGFMLATQYCLRNSDAVVTTSCALADIATALVERRLQPQVIYKGVDQHLFKKRDCKDTLAEKMGFDARGPIVVFVGRIEKDKGVRELFEAFCRLKPHFAGLTLIIVGDGSYRGQIQLKVIEAGVSGSVVVTGRVLQEDVADYLAIAHIFVLPSYEEGMPNALLEAMASGLPCIATQVGGNPEAVQDGINGILIPPRDAGTLVQALSHLLTHPDQAARLATAAANTARVGFSWRANAEANIAVYQAMLRPSFH